MYKEKVKNQFGIRAKTFNESATWITDQSLINAHLAAANVSVGKALDLCCGTGIIGRAFQDCGWEMMGIDITREMVAEANKYFPTIKGCAEHMPFESNKFDLLVMRQAMFMLKVPKVLQEVKRVLKKNGQFILSQTVPFSEVDAPFLKKVHFCKQAQMKNFYTADDLENYMLENGYVIWTRQELRIKESITRWMNFAPELTPGKRQQIYHLIKNAPGEYRKLRNVEVVDNQLWEDWNWVIFGAGFRDTNEKKIG
jgi:DNA gyrase subunit B